MSIIFDADEVLTHRSLVDISTRLNTPISGGFWGITIFSIKSLFTHFTYRCCCSSSLDTRSSKPLRSDWKTKYSDNTQRNLDVYFRVDEHHWLSLNAPYLSVCLFSVSSWPCLTIQQVKRIIVTLFTPNSLSSAHNYIHTNRCTQNHYHILTHWQSGRLVVVVVLGGGGVLCTSV